MLTRASGWKARVSEAAQATAATKQTRVTVYHDMGMNSGYKHLHHTPVEIESAAGYTG
jgi:hypothetical protein